MRVMLLGLCAAMVFVAPVSAVELSQKGPAALISGAIKDGDHFKLREFLARPEAAQIRTFYLDSPGGRIDPAREMARQIREKGYTTAVDAARGRCESACTGLFVAGTRRLYLNAGAISDGEGKIKRGLGFHEGNSSQRAGGRGYSGGATSGMVNIYYEMGVPGAASLVTKAAFNSMYHISAQTALSLGVATGLSGP
jgi:hypothetical protein